jgi:HSP20 family protein
MNLIKRQENFIPSVWDNLLENSLFSHSANGHSEKTIPAVNLSENKDNFFIEVAAPGLKKEAFTIKLVKNKLTVSVEKEEKETDKKFSRIEFGFNSFSRTFTLPNVANLNKIDASYTDGILTISIAKKEEAKEIAERNIEIK